MRQTQILPLMSKNNSGESESKNRVGVWIVIFVLCLLPYERLMLPYGLKVVDIALVVLILCALTGFLFLGQRIRLPLVMPMWLIIVASVIAMILSSAHFDLSLIHI